MFPPYDSPRADHAKDRHSLHRYRETVNDEFLTQCAVRHWLHLLSTDKKQRPLAPGARTISLLLGCTAAAGVIGDLLLYAVNLRAEGPLSVGTVTSAFPPFFAGTLLVLAPLPALFAIRRGHRWRPPLLSLLTVMVAMVVGIYLIALLHDDCVKIPGCTGRSAVIYFVSFDQFLYFMAVLTAWLALLTAFLRAIWLRLRPSE